MAELKQLHQGGPERPALVFIHGLQVLGGDAIETWRHETAAAEDCWPHWLGRETNCDTWVLEYDAALSAWTEQAMPLPTQGDQVASLLTAKPELEGRPLILVGHSMGGLVIKYALVGADTKGDARLETLRDHTRGVVFIATPHAGSHLATLARAFRLLLRINPQVGDLALHDSHLQQINQQFRALRAKQNFRVLAFKEQRDVTLRMKRWFGSHVRTFGLRVVDSDSSDPGLDGVVATPLGEDHFSICKPRDRTKQIHLELVKFVKSLAGETQDSLLPLPGMRYASRFYVQRKWENDVIKALSNHTSVTLYGSERFGKSWFARRIVELMPHNNWIELSLTDCSTADFSGYLKCLAYQLCDGLDRTCQGKVLSHARPIQSIDEIWKGYGGPQSKLEEVLRRYDTAVIEGTVLLCDDIDAVLPSEGKKTALDSTLVGSLLKMMQAWQQKRGVPCFLFTISTTAARINGVLGNSSPFSRTFEKDLEELGITELETLAGMYGLKVDRGDMETLVQWIGGHPFLAGIAFQRVCESRDSLSDVRPDWFHNYTDRLTKHLNEVPALKGAMQQVCRGQTRVDNEDQANQLRRIGLIVGEQGSLAPRNSLYKSLWSSQ